MNSNTELIIYTTDDGVTKVEATFDGEYCLAVTGTDGRIVPEG